MAKITRTYQGNTSALLKDLKTAGYDAVTAPSKSVAGATVVTVNPPFGEGTKVEAILAAYKPVETSAPATSSSASLTLSELLGIPTLIGHDTFFSGKPLLVEHDRTFSGKPLLAAHDKFFSGEPLLLAHDKFFSGTPLLVEHDRTFSGKPLLVAHDKFFSGKPLLTKSDLFVSGEPLLSK